MKRLVPIFAVVAVVAGTGVSVLPASGAVGTWTKITSPAGPGAELKPFLNVTNGSGPNTTISGTTSADLVAGTDTINIYCFSFADQNVAGPLNATPLAVTPSHTFSGPAALAQSIAPCVLRAVPSTYTGITSGRNDGYAGAFAGPKLFLGAWATTVPKIYGEAVISTLTRGLVEVSSPDVDGIALATPTDAFSGSFGPPLSSGSS